MKTQVTSFLKKFSLLVPVSVMMILATSCGEKSIVRDVKLRTLEESGYVYADLAVELNLGNVMLPSISIPIVNPSDPAHVYGEVGILGGFNGVNEINVSVNLTELLQVQGGIASLPDGSALPIAGLNGAAVAQIPIFNGKHKLYLAAESGVAMFGFALTFRELDGIGRAIQGADIIIPFTMGKFRGAAGFFTSKQSGGTGICVFLDIGQVIYPSELLEIKSLGADDGVIMKSMSSSARYVSDRSTISFKKKSTSRRKRSKFNRYLYKLHKKHKRLHLN